MTHQFKFVTEKVKEAEERAIETARSRASAAEENRRTMPQVSKWLDETREAFGKDCKVSFTSEGGVTRGTRSPHGIHVVTDKWVGPPMKKVRE